MKSEYPLPGMRTLLVLDTTLRDGDQAAGFSFSPKEKLALAQAIYETGVDIIETGFPASSRLDAEACSLISAELDPSVLVSVFCWARAEDIRQAYSTFARPDRGVLHVSLPVSDRHIASKLGTTRSGLLEMARGAVSFAAGLAGQVEMGAEDATRADPAFLAEYCQAVTEAGATIVNIADTLGTVLPEDYAALIRSLVKNVPAFRDGSAVISVHCHNDLGLALANTLSGVGAGAGQIEVTALGIGERAGNTALEEVAALLERNGHFAGTVPALKSDRMGALASLVSSITGTALSPMKPVTGVQVRSHASGIHQQGLLKDPYTYRSVYSAEGFPPERIVLSRHSGRAGLEYFLKTHFGLRILETLPEGLCDEILSGIKAVPDSPLVTVTGLAWFLADHGVFFGTIYRVTFVSLVPRDERWFAHARIESRSEQRQSLSSVASLVEHAEGAARSPISVFTNELTAEAETGDRALHVLVERLTGVSLAPVRISSSGYGEKIRLYGEFVCRQGMHITGERRGTQRDRLYLELLLDAVNAVRANSAGVAAG